MHVMIDLETLNTTPDAVIMQIGAVEFSDVEIYPEHRFNRHLEMESQVRDDERTIGIDTLAWWTTQPGFSGLLQDDKSKHDLGCVLFELAEWFGTDRVETVWANGPHFDMIILEHAMRHYRVDVPWSFRKFRDFRTLTALAGFDKEDRVVPEHPHDALSDSMAQAQTVINAHERMGLEIT